MANFIARFTAGVQLVSWMDPPADLPTRLNSVGGIGPTYYQARPLRTVKIACKPDGLAEGAPDSALGGKLFTCFWTEWSGFPPDILQSTPGYSSLIEVTPEMSGHYLLTIYREDGGGQCLRFTCDDEVIVVEEEP